MRARFSTRRIVPIGRPNPVRACHTAPMVFGEAVEVSNLEGVDDATREGLVALVRRAEQLAVGHAESTPADVWTHLTGPDAEPRAGAVVRLAGAVVGVRFVESYSEARDVVLEPYVSSELPREQRAELLDSLLLDGVSRAREVARSFPDRAEPGPDPEPRRELVGADPYWDSNPDRWQIEAWPLAEDSERIDAFRRAGFRKARTFVRMRHVSDPSKPAPKAPAGVRIRIVDSDPDLRAVHGIFNEAFADHWGETPRPFAAWLANHRARPGHDPEQWLLAELDGSPCGICLMDDSRVPHGYGHVETLGVVRRARGRGVAEYLLRSAFAASSARGLSGTELEVDDQSPTGADRLYLKLGMIPMDSFQVWLRPLDP